MQDNIQLHVFSPILRVTPFLVKLRSGRGEKPIKYYARVFVCMATKAVHLNLVNDLTNDAFLSAL